MKRIMKFFSRLFTQKTALSQEALEKIKLDFQERYHNFRILLAANNRVLERIADIQRMLLGEEPFGITYIKSRTTTIFANVYTMIKILNAISQNKYEKLYARFDAIQSSVEGLYLSSSTNVDHRLIISLDEINKEMVDVVGNKMANLGEVRNVLHLPTPPGFAITTTAYRLFLSANDLFDEIEKRIQIADISNTEARYQMCSQIRQMIIKAEIPQPLQVAISDAASAMNSKTTKPVKFAVRSSAIGEDSLGSSFAGQYLSILNVGGEEILHAYKEVIASKYSFQAFTYRFNKGFKDEDIRMCVGCLVMVDARGGGVLYTKNPVNADDDSLYINAMWGLPKSVVDGSVTSDLIVVNRTQPLSVEKIVVQTKEAQFVCSPTEGTCRQALAEEMKNQAALSSDQALSLSKTCLRIEEHYAAPQDVEWAITADNAMYILQSRPIKQRAIANHTREDLCLDADCEVIVRDVGITASTGIAYGKAFHVRKDADILEFPIGAVLVAHQAHHHWASLMDRAAAVITEHGSFAGHLANVAREFNVPAVFGIPDVMKIVSHGEAITMNADTLTIYKGKIEALLQQVPSKEKIMKDTPLYNLLKEISRHIVPLYLLDPQHVNFAADHCRTLHDITRFIHEKSVQEMFDFGVTREHVQLVSKQLYCNVPMQWWILNLDDGFTSDIPGKYVTLDKITSIPMLAFWQGYVAIPWAGPPVDARGFMSVMFTPTSAPGLKKRRNTDKNYIMIAKHYCHIEAAIGYHFTSIEALVSERDAENFVNFHYKGGATDYARRKKRLDFIGDILSDYGFTTEVREDSLIARVDACPAIYMIQRLKIIGYLTLHTRQIDVVMSTASSSAYYSEKFTKDIATILASAT